MLSINIRPLAKVCAGISGGIARIWIFDPDDFVFTQAPLNANTGPQPYTGLMRRVFGGGALIDSFTNYGTITSITLTNGGTGYTGTPTVSFSGGGGTGAAANAVVVGGVVTAIEITNVGSGYTSAPIVTISGGSGSGAVATATVGAGAITNLLIAHGGSGYTVAPTIVISGGGGSGATATATVVGGVITAVTLTNPGTGYMTAPTVTVQAGGATAAGGAKMFPISFSKNGNEAEYTYTQSRNGTSVKYEHQLEFFTANLDQLQTQWNQAVDAAGACSGIGLVMQFNSGKIFVAGEKWINDNPVDIPLLIRQDGSTGTTGKLLDDPNGQTSILKGDYVRTLYEFTGGLNAITAME